MPRGEGTGTLAQKLVREFEAIQRGELPAGYRPYETYGASAKRRSNELLERSKRGRRAPGKEWDLRQFPEDELRLARSDENFAKELLRNYDPSFRDRQPSRQDIDAFERTIDRTLGNRLFPNLRQGEPIPLVDPQRAAQIREGFTARLAENQDLARQAQTLLGQSNRLAPLSTLHTSARDLIQRNNPSESLRLGREEIAAAGRENIPRAIDPYLRQSSQPMREYIRQYEANYQPLIDNFRAEARRDFLENDLPRINTQYASRGAFHGSARERALDKARRDKEERIEREISRLKVQARHEAEKNFHAERGHHLKQAEVAGHAHQAERAGRLQGAEALRANNLSEQAVLHQQAANLSQLGRAEQEQAQRELDVRLQEHEREMQRPYEQQLMKSQIAAGNPQPHFQFSPASTNPPVPNALNAASGLLGQMIGLAGQQQQRAAAGGHIRKGYAGGDSVTRAANQLQQMANHIQETPEEAEMRNSAQAFKNHHTNPMADYLFAAGSHQLANPTESPMKNFGQGAQLGMQAFKQAQASNLTAQEKYNNLMGKINDSKMNMRGFLAKHHNSMLQQEEMMRHHQAQEGESRRAHDIMQEHYRAKDSMGIGRVNQKKSPTEIKLAHDARKDLVRALRMKKELGNLGNLIKQTSSGPIIGGIKSILPKTKTDNKIEVATNKLILDMHQGMKNIPRSEEFLKRLETTKPSRSNHPEANEEALGLMNEGANDMLENSIATLLSSGWTPEKIEKQFKIKVPEHFLEEESEREPEETTTKTNSMINMVDPEGNPLSVPQDQMEEALSMGATIVQ